MTLPIDELGDYYLISFPVKGDSLTVCDVAEDTKTLAEKLVAALKLLRLVRKTLMAAPEQLDGRGSFLVE